MRNVIDKQIESTRDDSKVRSGTIRNAHFRDINLTAKRC